MTAVFSEDERRLLVTYDEARDGLIRGILGGSMKTPEAVEQEVKRVGARHSRYLPVVRTDLRLRFQERYAAGNFDSGDYPEQIRTLRPELRHYLGLPPL